MTAHIRERVLLFASDERDLERRPRFSGRRTARLARHQPTVAFRSSDSGTEGLFAVGGLPAPRGRGAAPVRCVRATGPGTASVTNSGWPRRRGRR
jgi:hypothetical protein